MFKNKEKPSESPKNRRPPRTPIFAVAISQQQSEMQTKLKETRKRGPNLTEPPLPPSELKNERERRGDEKESFSSENPRVGKVNKKGTKKKLGNLSLQTIALKGKDVHKTLTFLAAKGWE